MLPSSAARVAITSPPNLFQLPVPPVFARPELFHPNTITLTGTIQAVHESIDQGVSTLEPDIVLTLAVFDRFAPSERRDPASSTTRPAHSITLCLPHGRPLDGRALSLSPRQRVRVTGYLRDYLEHLSLQKIWANLRLLERAQVGDDTRLLRTSMTHVIVESLMPLPDPLAAGASDENTLILSGLAQRIWAPANGRAHSDRGAPDVCVRFATYDRHAEIIPPDQIGAHRRDPLGQLPTRQAHYTTLRFPGGRTLNGERVNLSPNAVLRVTGYMRSVRYRQSLHEILTRLQQIDRLQDDDAQRSLLRFTQHLVVTSCICFGAVRFDQLD